MDELFEALTLIQTGKVHNFPVILFGSDFWGGLLDWIRSTMLTYGNISAADLDLMVVSDSPEEIRDLIVTAMSENGWSKEKEEAALHSVDRTLCISIPRMDYKSSVMPT